MEQYRHFKDTEITIKWNIGEKTGEKRGKWLCGKKKKAKLLK